MEERLGIKEQGKVKGEGGGDEQGGMRAYIERNWREIREAKKEWRAVRKG